MSIPQLVFLALIVPMLAAACLVLMRLKARNVAPVAAWPWWMVCFPLWLPLVAGVCFGLAWVGLGLLLAFSGVAPL